MTTNSAHDPARYEGTELLADLDWWNPGSHSHPLNSSSDAIL